MLQRAPRWRRAAPALAVVAAALLGAPTSAAAARPTEDIDLVQRGGLVSLSQWSGLWYDLSVGANPGPSNFIGRCGCLVTGMTTILGYEFGWPVGLSTVPWYRMNIRRFTDSGRETTAFDMFGWTPPYVNEFLRRGTHRPSDTRRLDWGYKKDTECSTMLKPWALEDVGEPAIVSDGDMIWGASASGISFWWHRYFSDDTIFESLRAGRPVGVQIVKTFVEPDGSLGSGRHFQLIVGYDATEQRFKIVDPWEWTGGPAFIPRETRDGVNWSYDTWRAEIERIITYEPVSRTSTEAYRNWVSIIDDPAPIDILVVDPDGLRTGVDPATHAEFQERPQGFYYEGGGWADAIGSLPPGDPAKMVALRGAEPGTYRFAVAGTGQGEAEYEIVTVSQGRETVLADVAGAIAPGEVRRYEVEHRPGGTSALAEVSEFRPEARFDAPADPRSRTALTFTAADSFDVDGRITAYAWDFGDGATADGRDAQHAFSRHGRYDVTLTVTDDAGRTDSAARMLDVAASDTAAPTIEIDSAPALNTDGWTTEDTVVTLHAADEPGGSGLESLTYRAEGAQPQPDITDTGPTASMTVSAEGTTTITAVATDREGNQSPPHTTAVRIDRGPPSSAVVTPRAGATLPALPFVAGTAADAVSPVHTVETSLRREADGRHWDGTSWQEGEAWFAASGGDHWYRTSGLPSGADLPEGTYTLRSRATDAAGHSETPGPGVAFSIGAPPRARYDVMPISDAFTFFDQGSRAMAVNDLGQSVGYGFRSLIDRGIPVRWAADGSAVLLPLLSGTGTQEGRALGINRAGVVVGRSFKSGGPGGPRAVTWVNDAVTELPVLDIAPFTQFARSAAYAISESGTISGWSSGGDAAQREQRAVIWETGRVRDLGTLGGHVSMARGLNDSGQVAGWSSRFGYDFDDQRAFLWTPGAGMRQLGTLGGARSQAWDVNNAGVAVGTSQVAGGGFAHAFVWNDGTMTDLGPGVAIDINGGGQIVGQRFSDGGPRAVLWEDGVRTDLDDLVAPGSGCALSTALIAGDSASSAGAERAMAINERGDIVGSAVYGGQLRAVRLTPTAGGGDRTAPTTVETLDPPANAAGWHRSSVDVALQPRTTRAAQASERSPTRSPTRRWTGTTQPSASRARGIRSCGSLPRTAPATSSNRLARWSCASTAPRPRSVSRAPAPVGTMNP